MSDILDRLFEYKQLNKNLICTNELENLKGKLQLCKSKYKTSSESYRQIEEIQNKIQESINSIKVWNSSNDV